MKIVVSIDVVKQRYLQFKEREATEIDKATTVAKQAAQELGWDEIATNAMIEYVVGKAEQSLQKEKDFWKDLIKEESEIDITPSIYEGPAQTIVYANNENTTQLNETVTNANNEAEDLEE